ncbi:MAG: YqiA/YcfP family alpha/beta fold hydrolase [Promethearchaeota archaeon]|jgi:pimeloyl-ACP methyl ester carboxylesterase
MQIIYLYGFASGPFSEKAQFFEHKFDLLGIPFQIFDSIPTAQDFYRMRPSQLVRNLDNFIEEKFSDRRIVLFGSSYGGLLAAWYASIHPKKVAKLILIAPALQFTAEFIAETLETTLSKWKENGEVLVDHYRFDGKIPLNFSFIEDLSNNPPPKFDLKKFPTSTLIFHGKNDEVVPAQWSLDFALDNRFVSLNILIGDHQLLAQKQTMWNSIQSFLAS